MAASTCRAADNLELLRRKQGSLEQELERVKAQISTLEAKAADQPVVHSPPTWFIKSFGIDEVNSAGGVEPYFIFFNPSPESPVKYVRLRATLYNAVGDIVSSRIGDKTTAGLTFTGPLSNADGETRASWNPVWYNATGICIKVESVHVTFVSGKVVSFAGKNLKNALAPELANDCKLK